MVLIMCESTRVFSLVSKREFRHPHVIGQIMLLSRVVSHVFSIVSASLVDRLILFGGGFSLGSNMRSSRLVWDRRFHFCGRPV